MMMDAYMMTNTTGKYMRRLDMGVRDKKLNQDGQSGKPTAADTIRRPTSPEDKIANDTRVRRPRETRAR